MKRRGYNIFAHGAPGTGRRELVRHELEQAAAAMPPPEWCYVHNFEEAGRPTALRLPAGRGRTLRAVMARLIEELRAAIPAAFDSEDYRARVQALQAQFGERRESAFNELQEHAKTRNVALIRTPTGLALAPTSRGEAVNPEVFRQWPDDVQERIKEDIAELEKELQAVLLHVANGGSLLIDARKLLMQPAIWEELKRALFSGEIRIQSLNDMLGFAGTVTLQPQPIPLEMKIVLLGDPLLLLSAQPRRPGFLRTLQGLGGFRRPGAARRRQRRPLRAARRQPRGARGPAPPAAGGARPRDRARGPAGRGLGAAESASAFGSGFCAGRRGSKRTARRSAR